MKLKINNLLFSSILIQVISTQGVLTFLCFNFFGYWELKSLVHPLSFFFIVFLFIIKSIRKIKITGTDVITGIYLTFLIFILCINANGLSGFYYSFREVFVIFILTFFYSQFSLTPSQWNKVLKLLHYLVIINLILVVLTYMMGPELFMKMLTGSYKWGVDPVYKFQITNFLSRFWRSPAGVGSSGALAYFALFTYILMDRDSKYKWKKALAFILLFSSFTRSALLAFLIYYLLNFILQRKNYKKIILIATYGFPLLIIGVFALNKLDVFSTYSFFMRLKIWFTELNVDFNFIYGGAIGNVGSALERGSGPEAVLDSYWLMMLFSSGLLGILIWLLFFYEKAKRMNKNLIAVLCVIISGFFITLSQAIPFLVMFPMLFLGKKDQDIAGYNEIK